MEQRTIREENRFYGHKAGEATLANYENVPDFTLDNVKIQASPEIALGQH